MNFTTLQDVFVEEALKALGHEVPGFQYSDLPALTNRDVFGRFSAVPDLVTRIKGLHTKQKSVVPTNRVDKELKIFCRCAGWRLVQGAKVLEDLWCLLRNHDPNAPFSHHQDLLECLLAIRKSLDVWAESIDAKEFYRRHARSQDVRYIYVLLTMRLVHVIVDLTFSEGLRPYVDELADLIERPWLQGTFFFDGPKTYARIKKKTRLGLTAPSNETPKRFIPYGLVELTPFWVRNSGLYGHAQVPNELCIIKLRGALYENKAAPCSHTDPSIDGLTDMHDQIPRRFI